MKKIIVTAYLAVFIAGFAFSQAETSMDLSFYASTRGEMQINFLPQWKFPFLQGEHPLTSGNNIALKLDASLSPIWAGLTGDVVLTVFPFLSFNFGTMTGTGWNYDLFGKVPLVGLGLNRRASAEDPNDGVIGNGLNGVVWNTHAGAMVQFDLAAIFPSDWNHIVMQIYNEIQYFAYSKAHGDDYWYYLGDDGMNQNALRHKFTCFAGYMMPIFVDLVGFQFEGTLPFYNKKIGGSVSDRGYSLTNAFLVNFQIKKNFSIMTIARITNGFKDPITSDFEREWGFDRVQFIATWRIK
jgi:hypothetical protein